MHTVTQQSGPWVKWARPTAAKYQPSRFDHRHPESNQPRNNHQRQFTMVSTGICEEPANIPSRISPNRPLPSRLPHRHHNPRKMSTVTHRLGHLDCPMDRRQNKSQRTTSKIDHEVSIIQFQLDTIRHRPHHPNGISTSLVITLTTTSRPGVRAKSAKTETMVNSTGIAVKWNSSPVSIDQCLSRLGPRDRAECRLTPQHSPLCKKINQMGGSKIPGHGRRNKIPPRTDSISHTKRSQSRGSKPRSILITWLSMASFLLPTWSQPVSGVCFFTDLKFN